MDQRLRIVERLCPDAPADKKARHLTGPRLISGSARRRTTYFGVPCTASVTTARVSDGASISRKV